MLACYRTVNVADYVDWTHTHTNTYTQTPSVRWCWRQIQASYVTSQESCVTLDRMSGFTFTNRHTHTHFKTDWTRKVSLWAERAYSPHIYRLGVMNQTIATVPAFALLAHRLHIASWVSKSYAEPQQPPITTETVLYVRLISKGESLLLSWW